MDLIRQILINVEDDKYPLGALVTVEGFSHEVCGHHCALIFGAGLAQGSLIRCDHIGIAAATIERLTSSGHDFLDAIRQDTIWKKAKRSIIKPGTSAGLQILVEWAKLEVRRLVIGGHHGGPDIGGSGDIV